MIFHIQFAKPNRSMRIRAEGLRLSQEILMEEALEQFFLKFTNETPDIKCLHQRVIEGPKRLVILSEGMRLRTRNEYRRMALYNISLEYRGDERALRVSVPYRPLRRTTDN